MCPLMFNVSNGEGGLGTAAALYMRTDFYVPVKFTKRYPDAVAFVLLKTESTLRPVYFNAGLNLYLLDSKSDSHRNLVGLTWGGDMRNVLQYLSDEKRREQLEPVYLGPFVSNALKARLPHKRAGWRGGD